MEFLTEEHFKRLSNPGVVSLQLLSPHNSASSRLTITRVTVAPGARQPKHAHATSEQVWLALEGDGTLELAEGETRPFRQGELVRFADGDVHGFENTSTQPFTYLSVTSPPIDFSRAYESGTDGASTTVDSR
jgi:quercetin dioxygenase-like cupin family protein